MSYVGVRLEKTYLVLARCRDRLGLTGTRSRGLCQKGVLLRRVKNS